MLEFELVVYVKLWILIVTRKKKKRVIVIQLSRYNHPIIRWRWFSGTLSPHSILCKPRRGCGKVSLGAIITSRRHLFHRPLHVYIAYMMWTGLLIRVDVKGWGYTGTPPHARISIVMKTSILQLRAIWSNKHTVSIIRRTCAPCYW